MKNSEKLNSVADIISCFIAALGDGYDQNILNGLDVRAAVRNGVVTTTICCRNVLYGEAEADIASVNAEELEALWAMYMDK